MTSRHTVDTITDDELDELYERATAFERLVLLLVILGTINQTRKAA